MSPWLFNACLIITITKTNQVMKIQALRDFMDVVANGGYRSASRVTGRSQAMLTKSVASLESDYNLCLLDRSGHGSTLTTEGEDLLRHAQSILREIDRTEEWLRTPRRKAASVSLGVSIEPSLRLVPSVLEDYRRALPSVTVRMAHGVTSALVAGVRENRLELAVTRLPHGWEATDLQAEVLYQATPVVVARVGHPLVQADTPADLRRCDWIVVGDPTQPGADDASIRELFDEQARSRPRIAAVTDSLFGAVATLVGSDCVARLPASALDHPLIAGRLARVPTNDPAKTYRVALVQKPTRRLTREAQALAAMVTSMARISQGRGR